MTRPRIHGELLAEDTENREAIFRGHISAEECAGELDDDAVVGVPVHTWGRRGLGLDEDGEYTPGYIYTSNAYKGQRGAFAVTVVGVTK